MHFQVRFVEDTDLPGEVDFAFVCLLEMTYLFVKRSAADAPPGECEVLTRAWSTWQKAGTRSGMTALAYAG